MGSSAGERTQDERRDGTSEGTGMAHDCQVCFISHNCNSDAPEIKFEFPIFIVHISDINDTCAFLETQLGLHPTSS